MNFLIPLENPPQKFQIALLNVNYEITVKWNDAADAGWQFDISNAETNESIVAGVPMICGANCIAGLGYLGIGGMFLVGTDGDPNAVPTFDNFGINSNFFFVTTD